MPKTAAYAAFAPDRPLAPHTIDRRDPGPRDVVIDILYCGVCHSDVHQARDEWGGAMFPMVPGHEIIGRVTAVGALVSRHRIGDNVGVGCFVDSCRHCNACASGDEQFCEEGMSATYNSYERTNGVMDRSRPTFGGYSTRIVVDESYVLRIPPSLPLDRAAPLLCAGITLYSPLRQHRVKAGDRVAVVGLGGLGHMGVKLARAMGAEVCVLSSSAAKREDAIRLGAHDFVVTSEKEAFRANTERFDLILDTVSAKHDYNAYLNLLRRDGTMVLLGMPEPTPLAAAPLIMRRRKLTGSLIGGIRQTQEMLDFCAEHEIAADIELIAAHAINEAWERMMRGDVRYRFVIDCSTLARSV